MSQRGPFEPPWKRYAIRGEARGETMWLTDDGSGCDEACDFTDWDDKQLLTHVRREDAQAHANHMRGWASERGIRLKVVPVWEHMGGLYEQQRPEGV